MHVYTEAVNLKSKDDYQFTQEFFITSKALRPYTIFCFNKCDHRQSIETMVAQTISDISKFSIY